MSIAETAFDFAGWLWEVQTDSDTPVLWSELAAWSKYAGHEVEAWELRFMRRLSVEYVDAIHKFRDKHADFPVK